MKSKPLIQSDAVLTPCGRYRYRLTRVWNPDLPRVLWVMLNPSTADATLDDPTIRRCTGFAKVWGYGGIEVVNLFPLRAPYPETLFAAPDSLGPAGSSAENDKHLVAAATDPQNTLIVLAWGEHGKFKGRNADVTGLLAEHADLHVLARSVDGGEPVVQQTRLGNPRHPLYLGSDCRPHPFLRRGAFTGMQSQQSHVQAMIGEPAA